MFRGVADSPWVGFEHFPRRCSTRSVLHPRVHQHDHHQRPEPDLRLPDADHPGADVQRGARATGFKKRRPDHRLSAALHFGGDRRRHRHQPVLAIDGRREPRPAQARLRADLLPDPSRNGSVRSSSAPKSGRRPASNRSSISRRSPASTRRSTNSRGRRRRFALADDVEDHSALILPTIIIMLIIRIGNLVEVGFEYIILLYQPSHLRDRRRHLDLHLPPVCRAPSTTWRPQPACSTRSSRSSSSSSANRISRKVSSTSLW